MITKSGIDKYIMNNREEFQSTLLSEVGNVATKIKAILEDGNIDLLKNTIMIDILLNKWYDRVSLGH